jgi:transcriptional regulator with XRE-family HTH domain
LLPTANVICNGRRLISTSPNGANTSAGPRLTSPGQSASEGLISQIVNRKGNGGPDSLERIAAALGVPLGYLFDVKPPASGVHQRAGRTDGNETILRILQGIQADIAELKRILAEGDHPRSIRRCSAVSVKEVPDD